MYQSTLGGAIGNFQGVESGLRVRVGAERLRKFKMFDYGNVW